MAMVTDIEDRGSELCIFLGSDMARLVGTDAPVPLDVARRISVTEAGDVEKLRRWLLVNDED